MAAPLDRVDGEHPVALPSSSPLGGPRGTAPVDYTRIVSVDIQGQQYAIKSDLDPQYVVELAAFVDDRIRRASAQIVSTDALRTAVVAALNIADEFFRARAAGSGLDEELVARTARLERLVDEALGEPIRSRIAAIR